MASNASIFMPQFLLPGGAAATNYTLKTYTAGGVSTPKVTYPTKADLAAATNANSTTLTVNSDGYLTSGGNVVDVWCKGSYYFRYATAAGTTVWSKDNVNDVEALRDASGNKMLEFSPAGSAVNYIQLATANTGSAPAFNYVGSDTNVSGTLAGQGSGTVTGVVASSVTSAAGTVAVSRTGSSRTNTVETALTITDVTSGTAAAGIGTRIVIQAEDDGGTTEDVIGIAGTLTDASAASEDSAMRLSTRVAGAALTETWGLAATGAFLASVTHANTAARTYTFPDMDISHHVLQEVHTITGAVATGTTAMVYDDTPPTSSEGDQYMSLAITPKSTTSVLKIEVVANFAGSIALQAIAMSLLQDATVNSLAAVWAETTTAAHGHNLKLTHWMTSGTTSATTFKVRAGLQSAGTTTFNGQTSARFFGGVMASSISITEYSA